MNENLICRTCLKKKPLKICKRLTPDSFRKGKSILEMLNFCVPEMIVDMVLDSVICQNCVKILNHSYKFKKQCLKNELELKKYLNNSSETKLDIKRFYENMPPSRSNNCEAIRMEPQKSDIFPNNDNLDVNKADVNQNVPLHDEANTDVTLVHKKTSESTNSNNKKKTFTIYRRRFSNDTCIGCKNRILDVKYHNEINNNHICYECNKNYSSIVDLRKHVHLHIYRHECKICGKKCRDIHKLQIHLRSHTKEKPFQCPECGKRFAQSYSLHEHMAVHNQKDTRNKCEKCGKVLSSKYNLKIHMLSHNSEKKPKCLKCNKCFYTKVALNKHIEICNIIKQEQNEVYIEDTEFIKVEELHDLVKKEQETDDDDPFTEEIWV